MKRGMICWVNLEPAVPPEMGKVRPTLVISNSTQNMILPTLVVVPLSSQAPEIWPLRVRAGAIKGKASYAILPGIRQVNKTRLIGIVGPAPSEMLKNIDAALQAYLSD